MVEKYECNYGFHEAAAVFLIDRDKFTPEVAKEVLEFWSWEYDEEADPIEEAIKKTAIEVIHVASFEGLNTLGVKSEFDSREGWYRLDGSEGITLLKVENYVFDEDHLTINKLQS